MGNCISKFFCEEKKEDEKPILIIESEKINEDISMKNNNLYKII